MLRSEWSLSLSPRCVLLLRLGLLTGQQHSLVLGLLHALTHKLLAKSGFFSGDGPIESPRRKRAKGLPHLGGKLRGQRTAMEFPSGIIPIGGGGRVMRLNLGHLPRAALDKVRVWNTKSMGANDDFAG